MGIHDGRGSDRRSWLRRRFAPISGLALGIAMLGTIGVSGTLAQDDAASIVNSIIEQVWAEIFGGDVASDDAASSGGDINVGGNMGGSVTMGGGSGGNITMGGSGGGVTVGDDSGG